MADSSITIISAERHERLRQFLKDLWDYRELFVTFVQRDINSGNRYRCGNLTKHTHC